MSENNPPEDKTVGQKVYDIGSKAAEKAADAALKAADAIDNADTEKIGRQARSLKDKAQLWVWDNKIEVGAAVFFVAGVWVGRRGIRKAVAKAVKESQSTDLTFFELFGFEPSSDHVILPPVTIQKLEKMARTGKTLSIEGQGLRLVLSAKSVPPL